MKKLLAMLTTITSLSSITSIVLANAPTSVEIQENKIVNNEINYTQTNNLENLSRNKRSNIVNLPIENVGNWNLTTGQGYFRYLGWAIAYKQQVYKNYNELEYICASNSNYGVDLENRDSWSDRHHRTVSNEGLSWSRLVFLGIALKK